MYTHAHLRYAEAMAHCGDAEAFFLALRQANPIGAPRAWCRRARPRQANCYTSSSDAVLRRPLRGARRATTRCGRARSPLEGGWRVYSSGAGHRASAWSTSACSALRPARSRLVHRSRCCRARSTACAPRSSSRARRSSSCTASASGGTARSALALERRAARFEREANPVPRPAARWCRVAALRERLAAGRNRLVVELE